MDNAPPVSDEDTTRVFVLPGTDAREPRSRAGGRSGLWRPEDVARFLQVSRSWVYQKSESGLLPVIRMPGSSLLRFEPDTIRAFARGDWMPAKILTVHPAKRRK